MFEIEFYEDSRGRQPVKDFLLELRKKAATSKDARVQLNKITSHLILLETQGTRGGEPEVKHIEGRLWELRPLSHRIFFFYWQDNKFVLLHHFVKKTQKTPTKEIEKALRNMSDFLERTSNR